MSSPHDPLDDEGDGAQIVAGCAIIAAAVIAMLAMYYFCTGAPW
jgi:hypothetical protein